MNITNDRFLSAIQIQDKFLSDKKTDINRKDTEQTSFKDILNKTSEQTAQGSVKFSKHASDRLAIRDDHGQARIHSKCSKQYRGHGT